MLHPTMLGDVGPTCWLHLSGPLAFVIKENSKIQFVASKFVALLNVYNNLRKSLNLR